MDWKEILLNLGTPVVETLLAEKIGDVVILQRDEHGRLVVVESAGVVPSRAVYTDEKELKEEFPGYELYKVAQSVYYLLKSVPENFEEIRKIEEISERIKSIESLESRITRHIYQLEGLDSVVSSLLEPIPVEIILSMAADALSELFVTSVALYSLRNGTYELFVNIGREDFPENIGAGELVDATKYQGVLDSKRFGVDGGVIIPVKEGLENKYLLFLKREKPFAPEERSLLGTLVRILTRSREYLETSEKVAELSKLLSETRFIIESLGEFSKSVLSIHNFEIFISYVVDMIREMLQLQWVALYKKAEKYHLLRMAQVKRVDLPDVVDDLDSVDAWRRYEIKANDESHVLLLGHPLTERDFLEEFKDLYIEIVLQILEEAFKNISFQDRLYERERKIRALVNMIMSIEDFVRELQYKKKPGEVYELMFEYVRENYGVKGMRVEIGGMSVFYGEEAKEVLVAELEGVQGGISYYKEEPFTDEESSVLRTLSKGSMTLLSKMYLLLPEERIIDSEDAMMRFLREKAMLEGMNVEKLRFYRIKEYVDIDKLKSIGIGLVTNEGVFLVTDDEKALEKLGVEYERI